MGPNFYKEVYYTNNGNAAEELREALSNYKLIHYKGVPDTVDYKEYYGALVDQIGEVLHVDEDITTGNERSQERWTDVRYDKNNDFTFRHANTRQPLHTDAAYTNFDQDINFLICMECAEIGGATTFIDSADLIAIMEKYEPELLNRLRTTEVSFGKGDNQRKLRRIIETDSNGTKLTWNYYRVMPDNKPEVLALCEDFHKFLETRIVAGGLQEAVILKKGETAFFHDDRMLHGRNAFYGNRNLLKGGFNMR